MEIIVSNLGVERNLYVGASTLVSVVLGVETESKEETKAYVGLR